MPRKNYPTDVSVGIALLTRLGGEDALRSALRMELGLMVQKELSKHLEYHRWSWNERRQRTNEALDKLDPDHIIRGFWKKELGEKENLHKEVVNEQA